MKESNFPSLQHLELRILYARDKNALSKADVDVILGLPKETLVDDLRVILRDGLENKERIFTDCESGNRDWVTCNFPFFAMRFLSILGAEEALEEMLDYYRLPDPYFFDLYFQDWVDRDYVCFYPLIKDNLAPYFSYLSEPDLNWYARSTMLELGKRMYVSLPERREEIRQGFEGLVEYLINPAVPATVADPEFTSSLAVHLLQTRDIVFLPLAERLYEAGLVYDGHAGDLASIRDGFRNPSKWTYELDLPNDAYGYFPIPDTPVKPLPAAIPKRVNGGGNRHPFGRKVGRNEPCPCGSGRKYKRCCG